MDPKPKIDDFDSDWRVEVTSKLDEGVTSSGQSIIFDGNLTFKHGSAAPVKQHGPSQCPSEKESHLRGHLFSLF